jgi:hypothetical protein
MSAKLTICICAKHLDENAGFIDCIEILTRPFPAKLMGKFTVKSLRVKIADLVKIQTEITLQNYGKVKLGNSK